MENWLAAFVLKHESINEAPEQNDNLAYKDLCDELLPLDSNKVLQSGEFLVNSNRQLKNLRIFSRCAPFD